MRTQKKADFYEHQYQTGETEGPWWYQPLKPYVATREDVAAQWIEKLAQPNWNYLDLGCGEGDLIKTVSPFVKKAVGADIALNRLQLAKQKTKQLSNVSFVKHDFDEKLPFADNSFDLISSLSVMEYIYDPYAHLQELHRVLKPHGYIIIEVPNLAYLPERLKLLFGYLPSWPDADGWQGGRIHNFTDSSLRKLLEDNQFDVLVRQGTGFLHNIRNIRHQLLCGDLFHIARKR